ncbi:MAG: hypothetical protein INH43_24705 [Acidobacteriaceae bacterium]|nr:hypothetical protein [Acidobacteriaceae bacterium]
MGIHNPVQRNARPGQWDDQPHGGAPHVYKRANSKDLIEKQADGGICERKRITEYADRHGILIASHGSFACLIALAAQVHLAAAKPRNFTAFVYSSGQPDWRYGIVEGPPDPIVTNGFLDGCAPRPQPASAARM